MSAPAILFVCLGNICRSPLAEAAFRACAAAAGMAITADSAGTGGWHVGAPPDPRAQTTALRHGIDISHYRGRQVEPADFRRFSHIFALDRNNLADLARVAPADSTADIGLLLDLVPGLAGESVADPYYGAETQFEETWAQVDVAAQALVARLIRERLAEDPAGLVVQPDTCRLIIVPGEAARPLVDSVPKGSSLAVR